MSIMLTKAEFIIQYYYEISISCR